MQIKVLHIWTRAGQKTIVVFGFSILLCISCTAAAQSSTLFDSLYLQAHRIIDTQNDSALTLYHRLSQIKLLPAQQIQLEYLLGRIYLAQKKTEALVYLEAASEKAAQLDSFYLQSSILTELGFYHKNVAGNRIKASEFLQEAYQLAIHTGNRYAAARSSMGLAYLLMDEGQYFEAMDMLLELRIEHQQSTNNQLKAQIASNIGHVYVMLGVYDEAIIFFRESLVWINEADAYHTKFIIIYNLVSAYMYQDEIDKAYEFLKEHEAHILKYPSDPEIGFYYNQMGEIALKRKDYKAALDFFRTGAAYVFQSNNLHKSIFLIGQMKAHMGMADTLSAHKEAIQLLSRNLQLPDMHYRKYIDLYKVLALSYRHLGDHENAWKHAVQYHMAYESIFNDNSKVNIYKKVVAQRFAQQEEHAKLEKELFEQRQATDQQRLLWMAALLLLLLVIISLIGYLFVKKNRINQLLNRKNYMLQKQKEEIAQQAEEIKAVSYELKTINDNLEDMVRFRTDELIRKNQILEEYAFINAHQLRAPVARLLGLCSLMQMVSSDEEKKEIALMVQHTTKELDSVVSAITQAIEEGRPLDRWNVNDAIEHSDSNA
jgi:tetratricopeptide (TPR) repeat protein